LTLETLIPRLHELFDKDEVCVDDVQKTMEAYVPVHSEWSKYAKFDPHRYTRHLIDNGNGKFNLILLCWGEGHGSGIHDHSNSHCWLKVMDGTLSEKLYDWPDENASNDPSEDGPALVPRKVTPGHAGDVMYINDTIGLHRIENESHSEPAVSLHLYSPPFDMCQSFDERTGKTTQCKVIFWSKYGERTPFKPPSTNKEQT